MLNLVHKVGVLFHANDRLSRHMDGIADRFVGLEERQKMFESAQKITLKTEKQIEQQEQRLMKLRETAANQSTRNSEKQAKAAQDEARAVRQMIVERQNHAREMATLARAEQVNNDRIDRLNSRRRTVTDTQGGSVLSQAVFDRTQARISRTRNRIIERERRRDTMEASGASLASIAAVSSQIGILNQVLARNQKRITQHQQLVDLDSQINRHQQTGVGILDQRNRLTTQFTNQESESVRLLGVQEAEHARIAEHLELEERLSTATLRLDQLKVDAARELQFLEERRTRVLEQQAKAKEMIVSAARPAAAAGGVLMAGGLAAAGIVGFTHSIAEAATPMMRARQQVEGMGLHGVELEKVIALNQKISETMPNVSFTQSMQEFRKLHDLMGGPKAVLGQNLDNPAFLMQANRMVSAARLTFGMGEGEVNDLMRAADMSTSSNSVTGRRFTIPERQEHFVKRMELMFKALEVSGGLLKGGNIRSFMAQLQANRFGLSDEGFLRSIFYASEAGPRAGTGINSLITNLGLGSQAMAKNKLIADWGLLSPEALKDPKQVFRNSKGNITGYLPTALRGGKMAFEDPLKWGAMFLLPAIDAQLKKMGKKVTPEMEGPMLTAMVMRGTGRSTSQAAAVTAIRQAAKFEDSVKRAEMAETVQQRFTAITKQYTASVEQFTIETDRLKNSISTGWLPVMAQFLGAINPIIRAFSEFIAQHPTAVGNVAAVSVLGTAAGTIGGAAGLTAVAARRLALGLAGRGAATALATGGVSAAEEAALLALSGGTSGAAMAAAGGAGLFATVGGVTTLFGSLIIAGYLFKKSLDVLNEAAVKHKKENALRYDANMHKLHNLNVGPLRSQTKPRLYLPGWDGKPMLAAMPKITVPGYVGITAGKRAAGILQHDYAEGLKTAKETRAEQLAKSAAFEKSKTFWGMFASTLSLAPVPSGPVDVLMGTVHRWWAGILGSLGNSNPTLPGGLPKSGLHVAIPHSNFHAPMALPKVNYNSVSPSVSEALPKTFTEHIVGESTQTRKYEICVKVESNHPLDHHIQKKIGAAMEDFVKKSGQGLPNMGTNTRTANGLTTPYPGSR